MAEAKNQSKVPQYTGTLTPEMLSKGCNLARENAGRLARDARILYESERYQTAAALAVLSIEESGKVHILDRLALADGPEETAKIWKDYRNHKAKNIFWTFRVSSIKGVRAALDNMYSHPERPQMLETIKQYSLYSDCVGSGKWMSPTMLPQEKIKQFAQELIKVAEQKAIGSRTVREMELWIQNVKPFRKSSPEALNHAIAAHFEMLQKEGLMPPEINIDELVFGPMEDGTESDMGETAEQADEYLSEFIR